MCFVDLAKADESVDRTLFVDRARIGRRTTKGALGFFCHRRDGMRTRLRTDDGEYSERFGLRRALRRASHGGMNC